MCNLVRELATEAGKPWVVCVHQSSLFARTSGRALPSTCSPCTWHIEFHMFHIEFHMLTMHLAPRIEFSRLYLKQALDFTLLSTRYSATIWSPHFMKRIFGIFWYIAIYKYPNIEIFKIACPLFAPDQTTCSACNICKLGTSAIVGAFDCSNKNNPVQADFNTQIEICTFFWKLL